MALTQLIEKANDGYPDGFLENYFDFETGKPLEGDGDTLARFIVHELIDTFDETDDGDDQVAEAVRALMMARDDLDSVIDALLRTEPSEDPDQMKMFA